MPKIDTVVIGASAGGVEALGRLVGQLPADFPAAVLVVVHFPESSTSVLPAILSGRGNLVATHARDGEPTLAGRIYVAPPGQHMLVDECDIKLIVGPKENGNRPAIDSLFRTAAKTRTSRVVGVVLSGLLDDGTLGSAAIRSANGMVICQDPDEAAFGDMPRNAIQNAGADMVLPLHAIGPQLIELAGKEVEISQGSDIPDPTEMTIGQLARLETNGHASTFVCPECNGTLFEMHENGLVQYRCRVGHSYLPDSLVVGQEQALEAALWTAVRAIKEHNDLLQKMLARAEDRGYLVSAQNYRTKLEEGANRLDLLRRVLGLDRAMQRHEVEDQRSGTE